MYKNDTKKVFAMKRVLLAGATGYLGAYIAEELREKGFFVWAVARNGSQGPF